MPIRLWNFRGFVAEGPGGHFSLSEPDVDRAKVDFVHINKFSEFLQKLRSVMEDDLVCEYDSTWDTESDGDDFGENTTRRSSQDKTKKPKTGFVCISIFRFIVVL